MPDLPGTPPTIRCAACGFENTTTSLYCQDCGLRLVAPPSAIAAEGASAPAIVQATPIRVRPPRILSAHRQNRVGPILVITLRTLIVAALAASIIQIIRPPAYIPPSATPLTAEVVTNVRAALQKSAQGAGPFDAPWPSLNAYLAAVLQPSAPGGWWTVAFERALLAPASGGFSLFAERKIAGLTLYTRIDYHLVARGSGIGVTPAAVFLGRLPLPAWTSPAIEAMSGHLDQALASELEFLRGAKSVRITPQKAFVNFGSPRP